MGQIKAGISKILFPKPKKTTKGQIPTKSNLVKIPTDPTKPKRISIKIPKKN